MAEITRKNVLLECLEYQRGLLKLCSREHAGREAAKGMDEQFDAQLEKCRILQDLIQAYDSEPVRKSLANWQKELMEGKEPVMTL